MADDVTLPGTGKVIATEDVSGVEYQRMKLVEGTVGSTTPITPLQEGTPITGASMPTGGASGQGWMSAIWKGITDRLPSALTGSGNLKVCLAESTAPQAVTGTFYQATQPISGTVTANAGTGTMTVTGTVAVTGTFYQATQPISATSLPIPTGAATEARQGTGNVYLNSIDTKITACDTGAVVVSSSALPSGAATDTKQDTGNTSLASINSKAPALGQALAAGSVPVVLPAAQITTLTPPAAITGYATETTLSTLNGKVTACNTGAVTISAALPAGSNAIGKLAANTGVTIGAIEIATAQTLGTVTTVGTVTNLAQLGGAAIAMGTGVRSAGTQRVTVATDDLVPIDNTKWAATSLVAPVAPSDSLSNPTVAPHMLDLRHHWYPSGSTWERTHGNYGGTLLSSGARTATPAAIAITNRNARGIILYLSVTAVPAVPGSGGLSIYIAAINPANTIGFILAIATTKITAVNVFAYAIHPESGTAISGSYAQLWAVPLSRNLQVTVLHSDAQSYTYSLEYDFVV